jgi:hypothetical protein
LKCRIQEESLGREDLSLELLLVKVNYKGPGAAWSVLWRPRGFLGV